MATRIYLPATASSTVISPTPDAAWEDTSILARVRGRKSKVADTLATVAFTDATSTDKDILFRQYVVPLVPGETITGAQALKFQVRAIETTTGNNMFTAIGIRVIGSDGSTVRKTVLAVTRDANEVSATTLTNRQFTANSAATNYTTVNGDCLVIEIGTAGDPTGSNPHSSSLRLGDSSASDLAEDDASTTDNNPWVEFADTLTIGDPTVGTASFGFAATADGQSTVAEPGTAAISVTATAQSGSVGTAAIAFTATGAGDSSSPTTSVGTASINFELVAEGSFTVEEAGPAVEDDSDPRILFWNRLATGFRILLDDVPAGETTGTAAISFTAAAQSVSFGAASITFTAAGQAGSVGTSSITLSANGVGSSTGESPGEPSEHGGPPTLATDAPEVRMLLWQRIAGGLLVLLDDSVGSTGTASITIAATAQSGSVGTATITFAANGASSGGSIGTATITFTGSAQAASVGTAAITLTATGQAASVGTASITFGATADGQESVASAGSSTITFTANGLSVGGAIGTATITITPTAVGQSSNRADGSSTITFTPTADGQSKNAAAGSSAITFQASGATSGSVSSVGTAAINFAAAGQAGSVGQSSVTITPSGVGQAQSRSVGSITFIVSAAGVAQYKIASDGAILISIAASATAITSLRLTVTLSNRSVNSVTVSNQKFNSLSMSNEDVTDLVLADSFF